MNSSLLGKNSAFKYPGTYASLSGSCMSGLDPIRLYCMSHFSQNYSQALARDGQKLQLDNIGRTHFIAVPENTAISKP